MNKSLVWIIVLIIIVLGVFFLMRGGSETEVVIEDPSAGSGQESEESEGVTGEEEVVDDSKTVLGRSVEGREITAYHYGDGEKEVLLVGGIHGGYSWNTALVAFEAMDYFEANPDAVPDGVKLTIVPVLNPDGLERTVGSAGRFSKADVPAEEDDTIPGRFNSNNVDLNRNFDCDWQTDAMWRTTPVDGGSEAFSEPEAVAIRNYILQKSDPSAVLVWYSAGGGVFASNCHNGVLAETTELTDLYASASGYQPYKSFDFYEITGDMVNWLANEGIPAISVLLTDHQNVEWNKNKAGIEALLEFYSN